MTEYEVADLALSNAEAIRSQAAIILEQASLMKSGLTLFYTLLFAYVTAAFLVGSSLTKIQVGALNLLYLSVMIMNRVAWHGQLQVQRGFINELRQLQEATPLPEATGLPGGEIGLTISAIMVAVSIIFMWSVRHPKAE